MGEIKETYLIRAQVEGLQQLQSAQKAIRELKRDVGQGWNVKVGSNAIKVMAQDLKALETRYKGMKKMVLHLEVKGQAQLKSLQSQLDKLKDRVHRLEATARSAGAAVSKGLGSAGTGSALRGLNQDLTAVERSLLRVSTRFGYFLTYMFASFSVELLKDTTQEFIRMDAALRGMELTATRFGRSGRELKDILTRGPGVNMTPQSAVDALNKAFIGGLPTDAASIARQKSVATGAALLLGGDPSKMFNDLTTAVLRFSPKILDNLGIIVKAKDAYEAYAKSIGKSAKELTGAEKVTAFYTAAMHSAGAAALEAASKMETPATVLFKLNQQGANLRLAFGEQLANDLFGVMRGFAGVNEHTLHSIANFTTLAVKIGLLVAGFKIAGESLAALQARITALATARALLGANAAAGGRLYRAAGGGVAVETSGAYMLTPQYQGAVQQRAAGNAMFKNLALVAGIELVTAALDKYNDRMAQAARVTQDMLGLEMQLGTFLSTMNLAPELGAFGASDEDLARTKEIARLLQSMHFNQAATAEISAAIDKAEAFRTELTGMVKGLGLSDEAAKRFQSTIDTATLQGLNQFITALGSAKEANGSLANSTETVATAFRDNFISSLQRAVDATYFAMEEQKRALLQGQSGWDKFANAMALVVDFVVEKLEMLANAAWIALTAVASAVVSVIQSVANAKNDISRMMFAPGDPRRSTGPGIPQAWSWRDGNSWGGQAFDFLGGDRASANLDYQAHQTGVSGTGHFGWDIYKNRDEIEAEIDKMEAERQRTRNLLLGLRYSAPEAPDTGTAGSAGDTEAKRRAKEAQKLDLDIRSAAAGLASDYGAPAALAAAKAVTGLVDNTCAATVREFLKRQGFNPPVMTTTAQLADWALGVGAQRVKVGAGTLPSDLLFSRDRNANGLPDHAGLALGIDAAGNLIKSIENQGSLTRGKGYWDYGLRFPQAALAAALNLATPGFVLTDAQKALAKDIFGGVTAQAASDNEALEFMGKFKHALEETARLEAAEKKWGIELTEATTKQQVTNAVLEMFNADVEEAVRGQMFAALAEKMAQLGLNIDEFIQGMSNAQRLSRLTSERANYLDYQAALEQAREPDANRDQAIAQGRRYQQIVEALQSSYGLEQDSPQALKVRDNLQQLSLAFEEAAVSMQEFMTTEGKAWTQEALGTLRPLIEERLAALSSYDPLTSGMEIATLQLQEAGGTLIQAGSELIAAAGALANAAGSITNAQIRQAAQGLYSDLQGYAAADGGGTASWDAFNAVAQSQYAAGNILGIAPVESCPGGT